MKNLSQLSDTAILQEMNSLPFIDNIVFENSSMQMATPGQIEQIHCLIFQFENKQRTKTNWLLKLKIQRLAKLQHNIAISDFSFPISPNFKPSRNARKHKIINCMLPFSFESHNSAIQKWKNIKNPPFFTVILKYRTTEVDTMRQNAIE